MKYSMARQYGRIVEILDEKHVLVFQMGKVGSSTICSALSRLNIPNTHLHTFRGHEEFLMYKNRSDIRKYFDPVDRHVYRMVLGARLKIFQKKKNLKIISLVRDPMAVFVSRFFQDLHLFMIEAKRKNVVHENRTNMVDFLMESFLDKIDYRYFLDWFENELESCFKLNVYKDNFDFEKKRQIVSDEDGDLLVLRMEDLSDKEQDLADFLGVPEFKMKSENKADEKWYAELYKAFLQEMDFSKFLWVYDTRLARHFYTEEDISGFKLKWGMV